MQFRSYTNPNFSDESTFYSVDFPDDKRHQFRCYCFSKDESGSSSPTTFKARNKCRGKVNVEVQTDRSHPAGVVGQKIVVQIIH